MAVQISRNCSTDTKFRSFILSARNSHNIRCERGRHLLRAGHLRVWDGGGHEPRGGGEGLRPRMEQHGLVRCCTLQTKWKKNVEKITQCCGSETFISDPVSDPDPAFSEFRIRIRFRIRFRIRIRIRIRILDSNPDWILDSNPDPDPGFESGPQTGQNFFFF